MFISPAFAQTAPDAATLQDPSLFTTMLPLVLVFIVFYVMVIRPQNKRMAEHRAMIGALQKGDKVVTGGGFVATVKKVSNDNEVVLEIADGVEVTALRHTITMTRTPHTANAAAKKEEAK